MRTARTRDYWRRLRERWANWPFRLDRFSFKGIPSLGEGDLPFLSAFTVISGPNGVGKTTLLRAIWAAARPGDAISTSITAQKLPSGSASLSYQIRGEARTSEVVFAPGQASGGADLTVDVFHFDSSSEVVGQQELFSTVSNIDDLINGVGSRALDGRSLETINYLARRDYRSVQVYEVEIKEGKILPFFEVALGNDRYDSRTMGAGEMASLFLWWSTQNAPENSLILIEEPETYLSPACQEAFYHFLVASIVDKRLSVVATSHSAVLFRLLSDENTVFVYRDAQGIRITDGSPPPALLETIGIAPTIDTIVLVEDDAALMFCRQILERANASLSRRIEISARGGEGNIINALRQVGRGFKSIAVIGLFDGDIEGQIPDDVKQFSATLPGSQPIEVIFREMIEGDRSALQNAIGAENLDAILFGLKGNNHHDWYEELCRHLGLTKAQLFPILVQIWLRSDDNQTAARRTVEAIAALCPNFSKDS